MSSTPPEFPPEYVAADRGPALRAFLIVMTITTVVSITARFWSRGLSSPTDTFRKRFWLDDWFVLMAMPFILAQLALSFVAANNGFGRHTPVLAVETPDKLLLLSQLVFVIYFLYDAALLFTKASALFLLRRVFPGYASSAWFNITIWVAHALNVAWFIGIVFGTIFMCDPVEKNWNPMVPGTCGSTSSLFIGSVVPSVFIDFMILLLPMPVLWKIKTSKARKVGLIIIFLVGYSVIVVSLGRLITVLKSTEALNTDITYEGIPVVYWVTAEPVILLLGNCLPGSLQLGRRVMSSYVSPIMSKVSLALSTRKSVGQSGSETDGVQSLHSVESQQHIVMVSPHQDNHKVDVRAGTNNANTGAPQTVPGHSIRVDNDVHVV